MKKKNSILQNIAAVTAAITLAAGSGDIAVAANHYAPQQMLQSGNKKEAVSEKPKPVQITQERNRHGGFSAGTLKHIRGFKNQRQYRQWLRTVPQMRKSKKCRIKTL
jgi:hypothetical protein